jgi:hypothetical protein
VDVQTTDSPIVDALVVLAGQSYIKLSKWDNEQGRLRNLSDYVDGWDFVGGVGLFQMEITAEGCKHLAELDLHFPPSPPVKNNAIGFHA